MNGWYQHMNGWHMNSGWMPVSLIVLTALVAVGVWALLRARGRR